MRLSFIAIISMTAMWLTASAIETLPSGGEWFDTAGHRINCHGGNIIKTDSLYYWYGEHRPGFEADYQKGISCYSSPDLLRWKDEGIVLEVNADTTSSLQRGCTIERPKCVYNPKTGKYILWFHHELKGQGYAAAHCAVAVSDSPTGPYTLLRSGRVNPGIYPENFDAAMKGHEWNESKGEWWTPEWHRAVEEGMFVERDLEGGQMSRDMTIFVDDDGKAYHIYSSEENLTLHIAELTDDYTAHTGRYVRIFPGGHNEAPVLFKRDGTYWMICSGCTGWAPNEARMFSASAIMGPWTQYPTPFKGDGSEISFGTQGAFPLTAGDEVIFVADEWRPRQLADSRYWWLPVKFGKDGVPYLEREVSTRDLLADRFLHPAEENRPMIIWQWMDGLVTRDGITRDLEAFKEAGLAGVMNFQIGGPQQIRISDPENAIGSHNWKSLLRWTLDECERLGLTFGTHNCPGWSSSAYPEVRPEYSMQKLVSTSVPYRNSYGRKITLPLPETDPRWNYYEDVAVFHLPDDSVAAIGRIIDLTAYLDPASGILNIPRKVKLPDGGRIVRIGQTTNGKTNDAQAPATGCGLECDKLNPIAVDAFWDTYPSMVLEVAGEHSGKTFAYFEIDSYEAGGQTWSPVLPEEFKHRAGYDPLPYLPYMAGELKMVGDEESIGRFRRDWERVVKECVAENYYGRLTKHARDAGVTMVIEPYGTGGQKPFGIIDFEKIANASDGAEIATEFWQEPQTWGWRDMKRHEQSMRKMRRPLLMAEAFTCWPLRAWQDSPASIKPICDRAFTHGVNRMMLHAGAANPWPQAEPGMSFGVWGTHFIPRQTWWKAGGAKALFEYMARCQALLQFGLPALSQPEAQGRQRAYQRTDGITDVYFVCNPTDSAALERLIINPEGRMVEIWNPYDCSMASISPDDEIDVRMEPFGSRFVIVTPGVSSLNAEKSGSLISEDEVKGSWEVFFPEEGIVKADTLFPWNENENPDIRYFSGTATYSLRFELPESPKGEDARLILALGDVREMVNVKVNGQEVDMLWKAPYECDITDVVSKGTNLLELNVTNLWANRMIGDEQEPDDLEWSEPLVYTFAPGQPEAGRYLTSNPDWLRNGTQRPSAGRHTAGCFKFFKADSSLLPSGLLGPVTLRRIKME